MKQTRARIPKASDFVVHEVRQMIIGNRMEVGDRLPSESELIERFGLGRVTVREALRILERNGLVEVRRGPSGGLFVRHADIDQVSEALAVLLAIRDTNLADLAQYRLVIEPPVARMAAVNATPEQRQALMEQSDREATTQQHESIHMLIAECCGNDVFELAIKALHDPLSIHLRQDLITTTHREETQKAHRKIAKAIHDGDGDIAESAMRFHLERYLKYLMDSGLSTEPIVPRN